MADSHKLIARPSIRNGGNKNQMCCFSDDSACLGIVMPDQRLFIASFAESVMPTVVW